MIKSFNLVQHQALAQDSERGSNAIEEKPEGDDFDSCEGFEGTKAEAGRPVRKS